MVFFCKQPCDGFGLFFHKVYGLRENKRPHIFDNLFVGILNGFKLLLIDVNHFDTAIRVFFGDVMIRFAHFARAKSAIF